MGDDELNFTEQEARSWAGDSRNQPYAGPGPPVLLIVSLSLLVALMTFALAHSSRSPAPDGASRAEIGQADAARAPDHR